MDQTQNARRVVRNMHHLVLVAAAIGFGISSFVLAPLYIQLASNVAYADAWWTAILYHLTQDGWIDLAVFAVCYSATLYAIARVGLKSAKRIPITFAVLTVAKFIVNFFMTCITDSALPSLSEFLRADLPMILIMILLELLQYALLIAILLLSLRRHRRKAELSAAVAMLEGESDTTAETVSDPLALFTFDKLVCMKNPVQRTAFFMALVLFVGRAAMHQIYEITLYITMGLTDGLLVMVVDLISDLIMAVILYFVVLLLLSRFARKEREAEKS